MYIQQKNRSAYNKAIDYENNLKFTCLEIVQKRVNTINDEQRRRKAGTETIRSE